VSGYRGHQLPLNTMVIVLPMGNPELSLYEEAVDLSLADMRKLGEI
jgi:hypothetical protein